MITRRGFMPMLGLPFALPALTSPLMAQGGAGFYNSSKPVTALVGATPGAGADVAARYIAQHLSKHVPNSPTIVVQNVPGAAAMLSANQFQMRPHDGHSLLVASSSVWIHWLLGNENAAYDLRKVVPIMGVPSNSLLAISPKSGYTGPKDLLEKDLDLAMGAGSASGGHIRLIIALELLGIADKINFVFGYGGGGETRMAFERNEINLVSQTTAAYLSTMVPIVEKGDAIPLFQIGMLDENGDMVRDPVFPDIQTVGELYVDMYGKEPEGPLYEALKVFGGLINVMQVALLVHDDAPAEAIEALKTGAEATVKDAAFLAQAEAVLGGKEVLVGSDLEARMKLIQTVSDETMLVVRRLAVEKYGATGLRLQ